MNEYVMDYIIEEQLGEYYQSYVDTQKKDVFVKGINKINTIINKFLEEFDAWCGVGPEFAYWTCDSKIDYSFATPNIGTQYFMENLANIAPDIKCDPFLISLLHELGHHETGHMFEEVEDLLFRKRKESMAVKLTTASEEEARDLHFKYFNMPDEYEATMWAVNYMRNNTEKVAKFWNELQPAIQEFYKNNKVEVS